MSKAIKTQDKQEGGSYSANYSVGQVSFGYGETKHAPAQRMNLHQLGYSIDSTLRKQCVLTRFAVNDNLSISYTEETSEEKEKQKLRYLIQLLEQTLRWKS